MNLSGTRSSHRWAEPPGNFDTLNCRAIYPSGNHWGIPDLRTTDRIPARLVAYNDRRKVETAGPDSAVHFFLDDYRFETVWTKPERALSRIQRVGLALTPDFSLWRDMPLVMQLWQVYRSRWCGCWLAEHGVQVIPTVSWSTAASYEFAFAGIPVGSVVAVSTVGRADARARLLFDAGFGAMMRQLNPSTVLIYGTRTEQVSDGWQSYGWSRALAGVDGLYAEKCRVYPTRWSDGR